MVSYSPFSTPPKLEFEKAATLQDRIKELENLSLKYGEKVA
jgi:protein-arginine kinase activator protein McsA